MTTDAATAFEFGTVTESAERIAIVGTGPSMKGHAGLFAKPDPRLLVIAVNGAAAWLPHFDVWITIDPSKQNRQIMAAPRPGVRYYAAVPVTYGLPTAAKGLRGPVEDGVTFLRRVHNKRHPELAEQKDRVTVGNSGYAALGIAYHACWNLPAPRIGIFGIDGKGGYAYAPGRPGKLDFVGQLFAGAAPQLAACGIEVRVGSPDSLIRCWPRTTPEECRAWLAA